MQSVGKLAYPEMQLTYVDDLNTTFVQTIGGVSSQVKKRILDSEYDLMVYWSHQASDTYLPLEGPFTRMNNWIRTEPAIDDIHDSDTDDSETEEILDRSDDEEEDEESEIIMFD